MTLSYFFTKTQQEKIYVKTLTVMKAIIALNHTEQVCD